VRDGHTLIQNTRTSQVLEVIADAWELMAAEKGEWPKIQLK